ncbi:hypothetical protein WJX81_000420 [Elliptochloris bilobata]|uniref:CipC-like antibiotic response protein n=1 Tax=Elliptochloris bilobata TaxID=381761 RepID=A0AAW1RIH3_9CHLO
MGWFEDNSQHADALYSDQQQQVTPHEGHFTHEAVAGGAAFFAMREWEQREAAQGRPVNHAMAKEILVGLVGGEVDKLCETKGLDFLDREKAKRHAREQVSNMYDERHGWQQQAQPFQPPQGGWGYQANPQGGYSNAGYSGGDLY